MKKALVVILGVLMAVMFAAESYAAVEVGGTIDVRGRWRNDRDLNSDAESATGQPASGTGTEAYWEQKVNIWVDAKIAEGLKGYVELQSYQDCTASNKGWIKWGTSSNDTQGTGTATTLTTDDRRCASYAPNQVFYSNQSIGNLAIRYAYMDFMIPGIPVGIKAGHMPVIHGHSIWANTGIWGSDAFMIYAVPIKELMIAIGTVKGFEVSEDSQDVDLYGFIVKYTFIPKNSVGFDVSYIKRTSDNAGAQSDYWDNIAGNASTTATDNPNTTGNPFRDLNGVKVWNIMLTVDGSLDFGLNYKFEIDKQFGKLDAKDPGTTTAEEVDLKGTGLAFLLGADFKIADIFKIGFDAAYGSGDKCTTWATTTAGARCTNSGNKFEGYFNFNDYAYTMIYEDIVGQKRATGTAGTAGRLTSADFGLYNTMYAKLGIGVTPIKDMSIDLNGYYLRAVKENYYGQNKNIGFEGDLIFGYNIYKNLKWTFMMGVLLPGSHYEEISATDTVKGDVAWAFEQKLSLKF